jgi:ABC-type polysaccharide/polyol phosphate export permease
MIKSLQELWRYKSLLYAIAYRDIRIKYKQSIMGFMWAILMPLLIVLVGILVRYAYSLASGTPVVLQDISGVAIRSVPWAFTVSSIRFGSNCLIGNSALVTKIYFPKEIFPIAAVGSSLFDFCIASIPLAILIAFAGGQISVHLLWVPLLLVLLLMIIIGIAFFVSAASLFFRDVKYLVEIFLTFGIFVTPVFFDTTMFGDYGFYMMLNPLSAVLEGLDASVIGARSPDLYWLAYSFAFGLLAMLGGYSFFKSLEPAFAESI